MFNHWWENPVIGLHLFGVDNNGDAVEYQEGKISNTMIGAEADDLFHNSVLYFCISHIFFSGLTLGILVEPTSSTRKPLN